MPRGVKGPGIALGAPFQATHVWKGYAGDSSLSERLSELPAADADRPRFWLSHAVQGDEAFPHGPSAGSFSSGVMHR